MLKSYRSWWIDFYLWLHTTWDQMCFVCRVWRVVRFAARRSALQPAQIPLGCGAGAQVSEDTDALVTISAGPHAHIPQ